MKIIWLTEFSRVAVGGGAGLDCAKVALTFLLAVRVNWQAVPLHAPAKPEKLDPEAATAVRAIAVPELNVALHVVGQLIPAGLLVTVPLPATDTVNWFCCGGGGALLFADPPHATKTLVKKKTQNPLITGGPPPATYLHHGL
jgi:hypothetical protein